MAVSNDILYLKFDKHIEVSNKDVYLKDVGKFECANKNIINRLSTLKLVRIPDAQHTRYVFSVLKVIELIHDLYPGLEINNIGESDFIISYEKDKHKHKISNIIKTVLVCITTFMGAAFSIMAFNNDVGINDLFVDIYQWATGKQSNGFTILEITYCIGLVAGITIFFNHIGGRKLTVDPTPMEVELRLYEDDVNTTLVESYTRKESSVDVGDSDFPGAAGS